MVCDQASHLYQSLLPLYLVGDPAHSQRKISSIISTVLATTSSRLCAPVRLVPVCLPHLLHQVYQAVNLLQWQQSLHSHPVG